MLWQWWAMVLMTPTKTTGLSRTHGPAIGALLAYACLVPAFSPYNPGCNSIESPFALFHIAPSILASASRSADSAVERWKHRLHADVAILPSRGNGGYINIARSHHACGVTTDPLYAIFEPSRHDADNSAPADSLVVA